MPAETSRLLPKLCVLALIALALGRPLNDLASFALLAASVAIVLTGSVWRSATRFLPAALIALAVVAVHVLLPAPRIEEGHNVFLIDGPGNALEQGLPHGAYQAMAARFDLAYPPASRCRAGTPPCWRPRAIPDRAFAFAADGVFDGHAFSRRVSGVDLSDPIWLRLGVINDLTLDFFPFEGGVQRLSRDRHPLAILHRWQLRLPYFVMLRMGDAFVGSTLCWRGVVLWEGENEQFPSLTNAIMGCRELRQEDVGRRIFAVAIGPSADLAMTLEPNARVMVLRLINAAAALLGVGAILFLLIRWRARRALLPVLLAALALVVIVLTDITFIGGYRPFDAGDDGLVFSGFARRMLEAFSRGDVLGVLEGGETVYRFTPGMRYFRALEYLLFGDSFLGYLLAMLALPFLIYKVAARFLGTDWAIAFALAFVAIPVGAVFGTTYAHYAAWSARGYADPLGAMLFLGGLLQLSGPRTQSFDDRATPAFWGALMLAAAVVTRPNLVLGAAVLMTGVALAALWQRRLGRLAALCLGFAPISFTLWHNWYFGGVIVPLSDNVTAANIYMMSPADYRDALGELAHLNLSGAHLAKAARQLMDLLAGPSGLWAFAPLHLAATLIVLRVMCARRFEPTLRLAAAASLALSPIGFIYTVTVRYNLVMWLLTALITLAWIKYEGLALLQSRAPSLSRHLAAWAEATRIGRLVAWLKTTGELEPSCALSQHAG
ncbi:MAG TPA: hypothetical protein VK438_01630 [Xanthobacteraceae bacterium]|nr:hypothetical protein [Xanthobacteraceae bacterium]